MLAWQSGQWQNPEALKGEYNAYPVRSMRGNLPVSGITGTKLLSTTALLIYGDGAFAD